MPTGRRGIRIRGRCCDPEVRGAVVAFARWLREQFEFPIRVPVYLHAGAVLKSATGVAVASFFAPVDRHVEPYIRVAIGDYRDIARSSGMNNALAAIIVSLAHEVVHYRQWVETGNVWERGVGRRAEAMLKKYARETGFGGVPLGWR